MSHSFAEEVVAKQVGGPGQKKAAVPSAAAVTAQEENRKHFAEALAAQQAAVTYKLRGQAPTKMTMRGAGAAPTTAPTTSGQGGAKRQSARSVMKKLDRKLSAALRALTPS